MIFGLNDFSWYRVVHGVTTRPPSGMWSKKGREPLFCRLILWPTHTCLGHCFTLNMFAAGLNSSGLCENSQIAHGFTQA